MFRSIDRPNDDLVAANMELLQAAWNGSVEKVRELLDQGAALDARDGDRRSPLHCAAASGNVAVVSLLLDRGADLEAVTFYGETPLHLAVSRGYVAVVTLLLDRGASLEAPTSFDYTPLHCAVTYGPVEVISLLLDRGASLTQDILDTSISALLEPLIYRCRHSLEGLHSSDPNLSKTLEDHQRYWRYQNVDKHFEQVRRCDPKKAEAIETLMMIYCSRSQSSLRRLPYEMLNMVFFRI